MRFNDLLCGVNFVSLIAPRFLHSQIVVSQVNARQYLVGMQVIA
jgi:hypothetical protein